jgi:hypothetical protein
MVSVVSNTLKFCGIGENALDSPAPGGEETDSFNPKSAALSKVLSWDYTDAQPDAQRT